MQFGKVTSHESFSREKRIFHKILLKLILNTPKFVSTGIVSDVGLGNGEVRIWLKDNGFGMDIFSASRFFEFSKVSAKAASTGAIFRKVLKSNEPH